MDMSLRKFWEMVKDGEAWHGAIHGVVESRTRPTDWLTEQQQLLYTAVSVLAVE